MKGGIEMKIWEIGCDVDNYKGFILENNTEIYKMDSILDKGNKLEQCEPLKLKGLESDREIGDNPKFWTYTSILMISEKSKNVINKKFQEYIQFLPMIDGIENSSFYLVNVLNIIDAINYEKSHFKMLSWKYIVDVTKYVFNNNVVGVPIFKITLDGVIKTTTTFVNDEFKKLIEDSNLRGFKFTEVFDFES